MAIQWLHYPRSAEPTTLSLSVVEVFREAESFIDSTNHKLPSNEVLAQLCSGLQRLGFHVETGKKAQEKINVPVLFGLNGLVEKAFEADAYHRSEGYVLEVEAGRGVANNQFLKDLFQACMMYDVGYLAIAVRNLYEGGRQKNRDFDRVVAFFDTLYASQRINLPLRGILVIGY